MRDDFTQRTIEAIAKRAGFLCSDPACKSPTVGAAEGHDGIVNVGVAAHITAAAPGGPRYDPSLTREERRHQSNGIWLCQTHGKLVDSDSEHFTVGMLRAWKEAAEKQSFRAIVAPHTARDRRGGPVSPDIADWERIETLGLPPQDDLQSVTLRLLGGAQNDLVAFKRMPGWPRHAIALNLSMTDGNSVRAFNVSGLAAAIETFNEIVVIAPPGTGKTTTLLQVVEAILLQSNAVAAFVPLGEWSSQSEAFFQSVVRRQAFVGAREEHLQLLAHHGRLVLVLDGWNELDAASRKRARSEIRSLQREFPGLGIIVSTRRQALDVPISGPAVEIGTLTEGQQREIAYTLRGVQGVATLDQAWRTPGIRELVAIPLYLTTLLAHTPGETLPTTKEEVLRLFVAEHERAADKAEALRAVLFGFYTPMLVALAVEATRAANTTISDHMARAVVKQIEDQLCADGQIMRAPQPTTVLDVLVSHHTLVRSGAEPGGLSFQHQQFQEWYASFEVEALMRAAIGGNQEDRQTLRADVLNIPTWEESILFACERVSRTDHTGMQAVAASVLEAMTIDPMLAAEMIYRSSAGVWDQIREQIIAAVGKWHTSGQVDRAVRFMISTGRSEFAAHIWPLISDVDSQVHLPALRAGHRFRPSVLGADIDARVVQLPDEVREHVLAGIVHESSMDGIELAARVAQTDVSPNVQTSVIEALLFRRADRFVAQVLRTAPNEVWHLLAQKGYAEEVADPDIAGRLRRERQRYLDSETDPLRKIHVLLEAGRHDATLGHEVGALIEATDFPVRDQQAEWIIYEAHKLFSEEVRTALFHRLEGGQEIPFRAESLLQTVGVTVDEGPLAELVMQPNSPKKVAGAAISIVGPKTIAKLIDQLLAVDRQLRASTGRVDDATRDEHYRLVSWISRTHLSSFTEAILTRSDIYEPCEIALLAELLARHGEVDDRSPLPIHDPLYTRMVDTVGHWVEILLASPEATRHQFAEVAQAIERLPEPQLVSGLQRLLAADLARWQRARRGCYCTCSEKTSPSGCIPFLDASIQPRLRRNRGQPDCGIDEGVFARHGFRR